MKVFLGAGPPEACNQHLLLASTFVLTILGSKENSDWGYNLLSRVLANMYKPQVRSPAQEGDTSRLGETQSLKQSKTSTA